MDEVVREPPRQRVADREARDRAERRREPRPPRQHGAERGEREPRQQLPRLHQRAHPPPPVGHQLLAERAEGVRRRGGRRDVGRRRLRLRQPLHHRHRAVGVEGVHHLGRVGAVVRVDPVRARRVRRPPVGEVVPRVVDPHVEPLLGGRRERGRRRVDRRLGDHLRRAGAADAQAGQANCGRHGRQRREKHRRRDALELQVDAAATAVDSRGRRRDLSRSPSHLCSVDLRVPCATSSTPPWSSERLSTGLRGTK